MAVHLNPIENLPLMPQPLTFTVPPADDGIRLDKFLAGALAATESGQSREHVIGLIKSGAVAVSQTPQAKVKPALRLTANATVSLTRSPTTETPTALTPNPAIDFLLLYEDDQLAVISKPAGIATHPQRLDDESSLASGLLARFGPNLPLASGSPFKPGIVHRLDAETSGVMVIAKTQAALDTLKLQFREHSVEKRYFAIVHGVPDWDTISCGQPISRDPSRPQAVRIQSGGHPARTDFEVAERFNGFARITARPHTGRTHQIRIHLAHLGFPVICDRLYRGKAGGMRPGKHDGPRVGQHDGPRPGRMEGQQLLLSDLMPEGTRPHRGDRVLLDRQGLHAIRLGFSHPGTGERMVFEAPLPDDLEGTLMALRIHRGRSAE